jgi:hypothetical protein
LIDKKSSDIQAHKQEVIEMMNLAMWCLQTDCKKKGLKCYRLSKSWKVT